MKFWILLFSLFPVLGFCDVRLPPFFSDNLVFQQQSVNPVWGWADPGEKIVVNASWGDRMRSEPQMMEVGLLLYTPEKQVQGIHWR